MIAQYNISLETTLKMPKYVNYEQTNFNTIHQRTILRTEMDLSEKPIEQ